MEPRDKQRITKWLNIFLLVINVSAIVTFAAVSSGSSSEPITDQFSSDEFLKKELNLTDVQFDAISELDAKVFRVYQSIIDMQCEEQFKLLDELTQENPSMARMDSLALNIGRLHTGIKRQTIKHFMNIRTIVDDEQELLLDQLLIDMMEMNKQCQFCNKTDCDRREQLARERK